LGKKCPFITNRQARKIKFLILKMKINAVFVNFIQISSDVFSE